MNNIIEAVSKMNKGTFGIEIVTETEPTMRKTNNPFLGRVKKITTYTNAILGVDYQNCVNNRLERNGCEANYIADAPKGKKHYNAFFYQSLTDEGTFYLKIGMYKNTKTASRFVIDGHDATSEEVALLQTFIPAKNTTCQKQADAGLDTSEQYSIVTPKANNVLSVKLGERIIYQRM